jgi:hypothetical protein
MMYFQRAPRTYLNPPTTELEIQPPPNRPIRPTSSLMAILLPLGFSILGLGLSIASCGEQPQLSAVFAADDARQRAVGGD